MNCIVRVKNTENGISVPLYRGSRTVSKYQGFQNYRYIPGVSKLPINTKGSKPLVNTRVSKPQVSATLPRVSQNRR